MTGRRAIVVGGGFGGLAAAIRLQSLGFETTLLEKNGSVGGRAGQIVDKGYVFDMGPSLITAPAILDDVFRAAGTSLAERLPLVPLGPYYRIYFHDGTHLDYSGDGEAMKAQMARFSPRDAEAYDRFMRDAEPVFHSVITDKLGATPFDRLSTTLRLVPRMLKLGAWKPLHWNVSRYFRDFRHRFAFSFHPLFIGGNPFTTPSIYLMIPFLEKRDGVWFTAGGMASVVRALAQVFQEKGGRILSDHEVTALRVEGGRATGVEAAGTFFPADLVVSNADVGHTYGKLLPKGPRRRWTPKRLDRLDHTMSCFLLYIGVRRRYPNLAHHTLILSERYRGLIRDIFDRKVLPDDFSMYLHAPTKTDPSMAPEGGESLYVLVPVANNRSGIDWSATKDAFAARLLEFLEKWGLEGLRENLEVLHVFTPDDFQRSHNSSWGSAFGVTPSLLQTAWLRPRNRSEELPNLYLVGAGTHPGAGVPGVLLSAEALERCVRQDFLGGPRSG